MTAPGRLRPIHIACVAAVAGVVIMLVHARSVGYGFWFDDYMELRPYGRADVWRVLTGQWSVSGFQDLYHRPLAALNAAAGFFVFGLNARALHIVSLVELFAVATMIGAWLWRECGPRAGTIGTVLYLVHPLLPASTSLWISNQKHLLAATIVMAALLVWQRRRADPRAVAWWPIILLAAIGFYIKEDTVMVLPALLGMQFVRARLQGDVPRPSTRLLLVTALTFAVLATIRATIFPHADMVEAFFTEHRSFLDELTLATYQPLRATVAMFEEAKPLWFATAFLVMLHLAAARALKKTWRQGAGSSPSAAGLLWLNGLVLVLAFAIPLVVSAENVPTRAHLLVIGGVLMWVAGIEAALSGTTLRTARFVVVIAGCALLVSLTFRIVAVRYPPCGPDQQYYDMDVRMWPPSAVTPDLHRWLVTKESNCEAGRFRPLVDMMDVVQWTTDRGHVLLVTDRARVVAISTTSSDPSSSLLDVTVDGRLSGTITRGEAPRSFFFPDCGLLCRLRHAHRVDLVAHDLTRDRQNVQVQVY